MRVEVLIIQSREKATKIEQVETREEFWSFGNIIIECPPPKKCLLLGKSRDSSKVLASAQSQPDSSG